MTTRSQFRKAYQTAMANWRAGHYGTPSNQHRGSSYRCAFWDAFDGAHKLYVPGSIDAAHARAGKIARRTWEDGLRTMEYEVFQQCYRCKPIVGGTFTVEAGAPGIGYTTYRIERVSQHTVWYSRASSTVRELTEAEVR